MQQVVHMFTFFCYMLAQPFVTALWWKVKSCTPAGTSLTWMSSWVQHCRSSASCERQANVSQEAYSITMKVSGLFSTLSLQNSFCIITADIKGAICATCNKVQEGVYYRSRWLERVVAECICLRIALWNITAGFLARKFGSAQLLVRRIERS